MQALRRRFLAEGQERARQLLLELDGQFHPKETAQAVHQWIGTGGLLGYSAISRLAREVEAVLLERPVDSGQLRESLANLALAFSTPREARDAPIPGAVLDALSGKRAALVGFWPTRRSGCRWRWSGLARAVPFPISEPADSPPVRASELVVTAFGPKSGSRWMHWRREAGTPPLVFAGARDHLLTLEAAQAPGGNS